MSHCATISCHILCKCFSHSTQHTNPISVPFPSYKLTLPYGRSVLYVRALRPYFVFGSHLSHTIIAIRRERRPNMTRSFCFGQPFHSISVHSQHSSSCPHPLTFFIPSGSPKFTSDFPPLLSCSSSELQS